jgi:hypothetical protein
MLRLEKKNFWDVDINSVDLNKHKRFIIARLLERGGWEDFKDIVRHYGLEKVKEEVIQIHYMDKKTLHFCSVYFGIPLEKFKCYRRMPFQNPL